MGSENPHILKELMTVIEDRKSNPSTKSYTSQLFEKGIPKISSKVLEEAQEVVEAAGEAGEAGRQHVIYEAADVIYHLFVLAAKCDVSLEEIESELARRFGISGLEEKASRSK